MAGKIIIETPPVYGAVTGAQGFNTTDPWTAAQRAAGMRREIPLGSTGIGRNRVAPPIPVVQPRQQLAQIMSQGNGGGGGGTNWPNANRAGYTTSGSNTFGQSSNAGGWGYTPSGVRSSARNANGSWGTAASGNFVNPSDNNRGSGGGFTASERSGFSNGRGGFGSYGAGLW